MNPHDPTRLEPSLDENHTPAWLHSQGIVGNEERFARQFLPLVRSWAGAEVGKVHRLGQLDPDDLAQQILLKVFERFREEPFSSATGAGGFHAYLRRCVRNAVLGALRSSEALYRGINLDPMLWEEVEASADGLADQFGTAWARDMALVREAVERVRLRVGAVRWEAFRLCVVEECKGADVARRLGLTPSQVYNARHDIAAYLREELAAIGYGG